MNDTEERVFHEIMFVSDNSRMFILHTLLYWITQKQICDFRAKKANRVNKICLCHISHACVPFDTFTGYTLTRWLRRGTYWLNISFLRCGVGQYGHKWRFRKFSTSKLWHLESSCWCQFKDLHKLYKIDLRVKIHTSSISWYTAISIFYM